MEAINILFEEQRTFFNENHTKNIEQRLEQLNRFERMIKDNEQALFDSIHADFKKSVFETYAAELSLLYQEIKLFRRKLRSWSKPKRVTTNLANFPSRSRIYVEPLGTCLVIGAWNYPIQLTLLPAVAALAAGNTVILKPSELPSRTADTLATIVSKYFDPRVMTTVIGGVEETTHLLSLRWDKIFFTGSTAVGKIVYEAAAKNLVPVTLELGGKSPTFVFADADIQRSAQRIIWAKMLNAGQTCIAPDYLLVEKAIEAELIQALQLELKKRYSAIQPDDDHYLQIINTRNFDRLEKLIDRSKVCYGGAVNREERFIEPTLLHHVNWEDVIMQEEIFGPILPILSFTNLDEAIAQVKQREKPLSLYVYTKNNAVSEKIIKEISFGGGCINDSIMHLTNHRLPFGGVGQSGTGSYHGYSGFSCFSHFKSVIRKPFFFELDIKYPPYNPSKLAWIKRLTSGWLG